MSYQPVFSDAQIATIAANVSGSGFVSVDLQSQGMHSFEATNLTDVTFYVLDDTNSLVGVLPPNSDIQQTILNPSRYLRVQFDPSRSGSTTAFTATNAWNVYMQPSPAYFPTRVNES